jgi:glycogen debranching enzyme
LRNQGWKDSVDAVFHADGSDAEGAIALCEVQGYVYAARRAAAQLCPVVGAADLAAELIERAEVGRRRFASAFWCPELETFALALDGAKRPCRVRTSNAGHCLFAGIATDEHAERVARGLLDDTLFSGWGVRTVGAGEARFNPMSYHNGSVWPHDNALIAVGLSRYGYKSLALRLLRSMFEASLFFEGHRLPELFCGFLRRRGQGPTLYPVACSPQAWAAGSVFALLSACLGMQIDAPNRRVVFTRPTLPSFLGEVQLRNLRVGEASVDLVLHRYPDDVGINVVRRRGDAEVVNIK